MQFAKEHNWKWSVSGDTLCYSPCRRTAQSNDLLFTWAMNIVVCLPQAISIIGKIRCFTEKLQPDCAYQKCSIYEENLIAPAQN